MKRRQFLQSTAATTIAAAIVKPFSPPPAFELDELTIADLQQGLQSGKYTARQLVEKYSDRINDIDKKGPALHSVIELNPDAEQIAVALDRERKEKGSRGPLHGIPILIKDNIDTQDRMMTTAGSLALVGAKPQRDAFVAQRLREAGAIILGKTNLSEWANFRSTKSSSGWSGRGGQTKTRTCSSVIRVDRARDRVPPLRRTFVRLLSEPKRTVLWFVRRQQIRWSGLSRRSVS
jgi:amidase